ncbi:MAG TPA: DUF1614 domain-containing protein [Tepidanaerobacteraceae bacterium]|nr:DUF1614 domain-containing protein [Tepidanaerobacteraceae bacterium]HQE05066.1 DUF1614 domain-containing protein [Tepidanaerobacteraceae bacterium]
MPAGVILLLVIAVLIYFGLLQRVLDRMHMTDSMAIIFIGLMVIGSFLPDIPLGGRMSINIGGGIVPIALALYLIVTADSNQEKVRSIIAALITGTAIYVAGRILPAEPGTMIVEPILAFAIIAGIIAFIFGRSRRGAFIAGILGIIISDIISALGIAARPVGTTIGGAGILDAAVISGVIAVGLCEIVGETGEKLLGGSWAKKKAEKSSVTSSLVERKSPQEEGEDCEEGE